MIYFCDEASRIHFVGLNGTCRMKVLYSSIAYITKGSNKSLARPLFVEGQRMAVTIEGAAIVCLMGYSHVLTGRDVGIKNSIHVIPISGIIHHHGKRMPVTSITDVNKF